jgi:hypothetical protein
MKNIFIIIVICFFANSILAQDVVLPKNFKQEVQKQYNSISTEVKTNELKMDFNKYFEVQKTLYINNQTHLKTLTKTANTQNNLKSLVANLCDNGTFETGDINASDWNFYWSGSNVSSGCSVTSGTTKLNTGQFTGSGTYCPSDQVHTQVQNIGSDNYITALSKVYSFPTGNSKSLRLGNAHNYNGLESVSKSITINSTNSILNFSYAMVLENPSGHGTACPYFEVNIIDASNTAINYNSLIDLGGGSNRLRSDNPLLTVTSVVVNGGATVAWKDWNCITADLSSLLGKSVIIEFKNSDCLAGGHFGYTYLDNLCIGCNGAPSNEGSINLNQSLGNICGIPGKICVDYTLPTGSSPSLDLTLQIIQNGLVVDTLYSPSLASGSNYCFNLTAANTSHLNASLLNFDFKIIGIPKLGTYSLSPKVIGTLSEGTVVGVNNDYKINCQPPTPQCCHNKFSVISATAIPPSFPYSGGTYSIEDFKVNVPNDIPLTEIKVNVESFEIISAYKDCLKCDNKPVTLGSLFGVRTIGTGADMLTLTTQPYGNGNNVNINNNELIWSNINGVTLNTTDKLSVVYLLPSSNDIPCCATKAKVCIRISWRDIDCNYCEVFTCSTIDLKNPKDLKSGSTLPNLTTLYLNSRGVFVTGHADGF